MNSQPLPPLKVRLAAPRGFCAGVERAIQAVEETLAQFGAPVFVRHEIVHNRTVVERLSALGAIFINELDQISDPTRPVITSAHGIPQAVKDQAQKHNLLHLDATCPLVEKVHARVRHATTQGYCVLLIGHPEHPEIIGTLGQAPKGPVLLVSNTQEAKTITPPQDKPLAWASQTTLSVSDTADIVKILHNRFPNIVSPKKDDICYATSNRQAAVAKIAPKCDLFLVIGSQNSSNSRRLVEVALDNSCPEARLIDSATDLTLPLDKSVQCLGLTAGASAPESLVAQTLNQLAQHHTLEVQEQDHQPETVQFKAPKLKVPKRNPAGTPVSVKPTATGK